MRSLWPWASVFLASFAASAAPAQTYTINLKAPQAVGKTVTVRRTHADGGWLRFTYPDGKLAYEDKPKSRELVYSYTTLEPDTSSGRPGKCKIVYEKATETVGGKTRPLSYHGRTLVFDRKDGAYRVGVVGEPPLDAADVDELLKRHNARDPDIDFDKALTPNRPVAVGERWPIAPEAVKALLKEFALDSKIVRAEARLVKVYARGKSRFGVLEVSVEGVFTSLGSGSKFDPPATERLKWTIDAAIDSSSTARTETGTGELTGKGVAPKGDTTFGVDMRMEMSERLERSEERDDPAAHEVPAVEFVGPGGWVEFTSEEGRFTATFPGKPEVTTRKDDNGDVTTGVMGHRERGDIVYMVMFSYNAKTDPKADPKVMLKRVADSLADETKAKKEIERNGHPGIELIREHQEKGGIKVAVTYQAFYVDGRLYQVMVGSRPGVKEKVEARRFLDSFRLHDAKAGNEGRK